MSLKEKKTKKEAAAAFDILHEQMRSIKNTLDHFDRIYVSQDTMDDNLFKLYRKAKLDFTNLIHGPFSEIQGWLVTDTSKGTKKFNPDQNTRQNCDLTYTLDEIFMWAGDHIENKSTEHAISLLSESILEKHSVAVLVGFLSAFNSEKDLESYDRLVKRIDCELQQRGYTETKINSLLKGFKRI